MPIVIRVVPLEGRQLAILYFGKGVMNMGAQGGSFFDAAWEILALSRSVLGPVRVVADDSCVCFAALIAGT